MEHINNLPKDPRYPDYLMYQEIPTFDYKGDKVKAIITLRNPDQEEVRRDKSELIAEFSAKSPLTLGQIIDLFWKNSHIKVGSYARSGGVGDGDILKTYTFYRIEKDQVELNISK